MRILTTSLLCLAVAACGNDSPSGADLGSGVRELILNFRAQFGDEALDCANSYENIGIGKEHIHVGDYRMYVHDLRLVTAAGVERPLRLVPDGAWQSAEVALLDFTTNTDECTGDAAVHTALKVRYDDDGAALKGLRFRVGVPFAQNHQDAARAAAPLNRSELFWSWNSGYKFLMLEGKNHVDTEYLFHLGSTGCMKDANNTVTSCSAPNRLAVDLPTFDPQRSAVIFDVKALLTGVNLDNAVSCHSSSAEADCKLLFSNLGLPLGGVDPKPTAVFRAE